jgi:hypothetical protein
MKGELSGVVGSVFAGVADPIGSCQPGAARRSQVVANEILGQATPGTTALQADAGR